MLTDSLLQLAVGRLVLSLLPPGWPGYAGRRELAATLSASWMLGALAWSLAPWWWAWAAVLAARLLTLPGALRPRHGSPDGIGLAHVLVLAVTWALHFGQPFGAWPEQAWLGTAWVVSACVGWRETADRRLRALGVAGLATLVLPLVGMLR